jgi:hypothetical protein
MITITAAPTRTKEPGELHLKFATGPPYIPSIGSSFWRARNKKVITRRAEGKKRESEPQRVRLVCSEKRDPEREREIVPKNDVLFMLHDKTSRE